MNGDETYYHKFAEQFENNTMNCEHNIIHSGLA